MFGTEPSLLATFQAALFLLRFPRAEALGFVLLGFQPNFDVGYYSVVHKSPI